jgi:5-(carboxyamino)imidazole ribonucleotide synthase
VAATELAERAVTLLQGVGAFAVEMFITPAGDLFINEISPRVHNSGHLTQDACNVSQFEQHVRAVMGLPLVEIVHRSPAAMCNILYTHDMEEYCPAGPVTARLPDVGAAVYWYGKATGSIGRKMGHVNAVALSAVDAVDVAQRVVAEVTSPRREAVA